MGLKRALLSKVNNTYVEIGELEKLGLSLDSDKVELLDITNAAAERAYRNTLILVYLYAINNLFGKKIKIEVSNSLNKGVYSFVAIDGKAIGHEEVDLIRREMERIIEENYKVELKTFSREEIVELAKSKGYHEIVQLFEETSCKDEVFLHEINGYIDFVLGYMLPYTGYLDKFEIVKYRQGLILKYPNRFYDGNIPETSDEERIYEAFAKTHKLRKDNKLDFLCDLNRLIEDGYAKELILSGEKNLRENIAEVAKEIVKRNKDFVLIAGPSSSGKTTLAKLLCMELVELGRKPMYLGMDDFFLERVDNPRDENGNYNFEDIEAIDTELLNKTVNELLMGKEVVIPSYNFVTGTKSFDSNPVKLEENQIIVMEGIHCLNDKLTEEIDNDVKHKIYISPLTQFGIDRLNSISTSDSRLLRRIVRDYKFRGYDAAATIRMWDAVRAGEERNIFPYSNSADTVVNTSLSYEISILRKVAEPILKEISVDCEEHAEAQRLLSFTQYFEAIERDSLVDSESLIREFIGNSSIK